MSDPSSTSVTVLLARARSGDSTALADVFPLIYDELRRLAQLQLRREPDGHTLSPTVKRDWARAKLWLQRQVGTEGAG